MQTIGIIGAGPVGTAFGALLHRQGYQIAGIHSRTARSANHAAQIIGCPVLPLAAIASQADVIFITTPDRNIADVAHQLADQPGLRPGIIVAHTSGAHAAKILDPVRRDNIRIASLHPLQSCPTAERAIENLPGSVFSVQGDCEAIPILKTLAERMGGIVCEISEQQKPLYHAAACVASNYFVSIVNLAVQLLIAAGIPANQALPALMPLINGSLANIKNNGVPAALTGPIERGDISTIHTHLKALEQMDPNWLACYRSIGQYTIQMAVEKHSIDENQGRKLLTAFNTVASSHSNSSIKTAL